MAKFVEIGPKLLTQAEGECFLAGEVNATLNIEVVEYLQK